MAVDVIVRGSMWLALGGFVAAHWGFRRAGSAAHSSWPLAAYWIGAALAFVHALGAFHWHYDWSHTQAVVATAEQTADIFGLNWGGGVWVNYAFLVVWLADAGRRMASHRPEVAESTGTWVLRCFYLIIIANGAITFVEWPMNLVGAGMVAVLVWCWWPPRLRFGAEASRG